MRDIGRYSDELNIKAYAVGGYVRDHYLGRERTDIDCTVEGDAVDFARKLARKFRTKAVVYERFGTALVPIAGYSIEFVGTRKEKYLPDSRKPIVANGTFEDDIKRRDFTINAMAASLNESTFGNVIDLLGGMDDLKNRLLRTPVDPEITFNDDPLRMMRAARFAAQLGFAVDPAIKEATGKLAERIKIISQERITAEFQKLLASPKPSIGLFFLYDTGLFKYIFPEIHNLSGVEIIAGKDGNIAHKDVLRHSFKVVDNIAQKTDYLWLRFAALVHDIAKPTTKRFSKTAGWTFHGHDEFGARWMKGIFRRLRLPMDKLPYVEKLVRLHQRPMALVDDGVTDSAVRRLAVKAGDALEDLFTLCRADITTKNHGRSSKYLDNYERVFQKVIDVQAKDKLRAFQSPVRGEEIMEICGLPPSRLVGYIKDSIEEAILDGIIPNEYDDAKAYFIENKDKWMKEFGDG